MIDSRPSDVRRHRAERYVILLLLSRSDRPFMPFRTLSMAMDRYNHPIADEALEFHLERVLEPDGLVELRKVRDLSAELREFDRRSPDAIDAVKLTRRGITALNEPEKFEEVERP